MWRFKFQQIFSARFFSIILWVILCPCRWSTILSLMLQSWSWRRKIWRGRFRGTCWRFGFHIKNFLNKILGAQVLRIIIKKFATLFTNVFAWSKTIPAEPAWSWSTVPSACSSVQWPGLCGQANTHCFQTDCWPGGKFAKDRRPAGKSYCSLRAWRGRGFEITKQILG